MECHSPADWLQLFIATTQVRSGGSARLHPRVGWTEGGSGSVTTPGLSSPPGGAVLQSPRSPFEAPNLLGIDLAIWTKMFLNTNNLLLVVLPRFKVS